MVSAYVVHLFLHSGSATQRCQQAGFEMSTQVPPQYLLRRINIYTKQFKREYHLLASPPGVFRSLTQTGNKETEIWPVKTMLGLMSQKVMKSDFSVIDHGDSSPFCGRSQNKRRLWNLPALVPAVPSLLLVWFTSSFHSPSAGLLPSLNHNSHK